MGPVDGKECATSAVVQLLISDHDHDHVILGFVCRTLPHVAYVPHVHMHVLSVGAVWPFVVITSTTTTPITTV